MLGRLLWNDIRNHKLLSLSTVIFMAASSLFITLAAILFTGLLGSVDGLMKRAVTPDYLQMHVGSIQTEKLESFAEEHPEIEKWQVCPFLNLDNSSVVLGNKSLTDSTQDNGLCVQNEDFDYLLDMDNTCPTVEEGEVYVPVCYRSVYDLNIGDRMQIGNEELIVAGFIRDSQMSSMMASSKRFLVSQTDYERIKGLGEEEYLIEFLLKVNTDTDSFAADYGRAGLYANGPVITKPLIRMMTALSDGIMILVILLVGIGVLLISLLCIRFITSLGVEKDRARTICGHWSGSSSVYDFGFDSTELMQYHFSTGICNLYGNRRCPDPNGCETIGEYRSHNREIVREVKRGSGCLKVCHIKDGILPGLFNKWSAGQPSRGNRRPFRFPCKVRRGKTAGSRGRNCIIKLTGAGFGAAHR